MSRWTEIEATFDLLGPRSDAQAVISKGMPEGSEGGPNVHETGAGRWFVHGNLRDRDEDDFGEMIEWFGWVVRELGCAVANLKLSTYGVEYRFRVVEGSDGRIALVVPPLYAQAFAGRIAWVPA